MMKIEQLKITILLWMTASSCVTGLHPIEYPQSSRILQQFDKCQGGEGSFRVSIKTQSKNFNTDLDWLSKTTTVEMVGYDPFGRVVLKVISIPTQKIFRIRSQRALSIPSLSISENFYLKVDDHIIGINTLDIGCFLKFKWPQKWLKNGNFYKSDKNILLKYRDADTDVTVDNLTNDKNTCAKIVWAVIPFISSETLQVCFSEKNLRKVTFKVNGAEIIMNEDI